MQRRGEGRSSKFEVRKKGADGDYAICWRGPSTAAPSLGNRVRGAVRAALRVHDVRSARISVIGVSDKRMAQLNQRHLGHHGSTDVMTFDLTDGEAQVEGEIVLSLDTARREAERRGHALSSEAALYAVHGVLHLLGYDDHEPRRAKKMHSKEDEILTSIGLGAVYSRGTKARPR